MRGFSVLAKARGIMHDITAAGHYMARRSRFRRSLAQWLEHRSPKPGVGGSSPSTPARRTGHIDNEWDEERAQMSDQAPAEVRRKRVSPFRFLQEVREEGRKVTWPTRRETAITTGMVFVMVAIASIFFLVSDQLIRIAV